MPGFQVRAAVPAGSGCSSASGSGMKRGMDSIGGNIGADRARAELAELLRRAAGRDQTALGILYERTSAKLYGICLRLLGSESEAQEVLQDVYVTIWNKASRFDASRASPITWLSVLARNKAIDSLRVRRMPAEDLNLASEIADDSPSAIEIIEQSQDAERLSQCFDELDERARTMIHRAFFEGATYLELASLENVPLPTMKSWIRRGLVRLRGCLER